MKYRKKPVVIEAMRYMGSFSYDEMGVEWGDSFAKTTSHQSHTNSMWIRTLEGTFSVNLGDWVIKGIKGEFYACKPDIFEATYEAVIE